MGKAYDSMRRTAANFYRWIFPEKIEIPGCLRKLLDEIYPAVNWDTVNFYNGMPSIFHIGPQNAVTLPAFSFHKINIYFREGRFDICSCRGLSLIIHEAFHVQQYRDTAYGWGLGFLHAFTVAYISGYLSEGYFNHFLEIPAYEQGNSFFSSCSSLREKIFDCKTNPPYLNLSALKDLLNKNPGLIKTGSGIKFPGSVWQHSPGISRLTEKSKQLTMAAGFIKITSYIWFTIWILFCSVLTMLIAVTKPILEILFLGIDVILWAITAIMKVMKF